MTVKKQTRMEALCKKAKLQAGIKPTALCSAIDKENSIESPLDYTIYTITIVAMHLVFPQSSRPSADFFVTFCDYVM